MKNCSNYKKTRINVKEKCVLNFTRRADHAKNA